MYSNILLTHKVVVSLFLLQYIIKTGLLVAGKKELLAKYSKVTRIPEMLISLAFLITGGWMLYDGAIFGSLMVIKLLFVFASIPIAIIGFRKNNRAMALTALLLLFLAYGLAEMSKKQLTGGKVDTSSASDPVAAGKMVYEHSCINCHGADGRLGGSGAKDLTNTMLSMDEQKAIIRNGKSAMPGNKDITDEQLNDLIQYVATLRH